MSLEDLLVQMLIESHVITGATDPKFTTIKQTGTSAADLKELLSSEKVQRALENGGRDAETTLAQILAYIESRYGPNITNA